MSKCLRLALLEKNEVTIVVIMSFGALVVVCTWRHIFLKSLLCPDFAYLMLQKKESCQHRGEKGASDSYKHILKIQGEQSKKGKHYLLQQSKLIIRKKKETVSVLPDVLCD